MWLRFSRLLKSRIGRAFCSALLVAAAWIGWRIAPPRPEHRVEIGGFDEEGNGVIAADGRSFIWRGQSGLAPAGVDAGWQRIFIHELPNGALRNTLDVPAGIDRISTECPTGDRLVYNDYEKNWHLVALPSGNVLNDNFAGGAKDSHLQRMRWSPDGRFLVLDLSEMPQIWRSNNGKHVMNVEAMIAPATDSEILADSSGLVALSRDGTHIVIARFESATQERVPLPAPPVGPRDALALPYAGSISSGGLAANANGSRLVMIWHRYDGRGWDKGDYENILACWDRPTGRWRETTIPIDRKLYDYAELPQTDKEGKYATHSMNRGSVRSNVTMNGNECHFYDLSADPLRSIDDTKLPSGGVCIAKELGNVICSGTEIDGHLDFHVYDTPFQKRWSVHLAGSPSNCSFSANKQWATFNLTSPNHLSSLSDWLPAWSEAFIPRRPMSVVLLHLTDGANVRHVLNRDYPMVTNEGAPWTTYSAELPDHKFKYILERWPHEVKTPWWLLLLTAAGIVMIVRDVHGFRRASTAHVVPT